MSGSFGHLLDSPRARADAAGVTVELVGQRLIELRPTALVAWAEQRVPIRGSIEFRERVLEIVNEESCRSGLTQQERGVCRAWFSVSSLVADHVPGHLLSAGQRYPANFPLATRARVAWAA